MKKQLLTAALIAAGLVGAAQAAPLDIGTGPYTTTLGEWFQQTDGLLQQDKIWKLQSYSASLGPDQTISFELNVPQTGVDIHTIAYKPALGPNKSYALNYTIDITPDAIAKGAHFTRATVSVDTGQTCPTDDGACSSAAKILTYDGGAGSATISAYQGAPTSLGRNLMNGFDTVTHVGVAETANWGSASLNRISDTFTEATNAQVPEPDSIALFGIGLVGMAFGRRAIKK